MGLVVKFHRVEDVVLAGEELQQGDAHWPDV